MSKLLDVPLEQIRENPVAVRSVNRDKEDFKALVDSIRNNGVLNPISVVEKNTDKEGRIDGKLFEINDGLHRFTGSLEANLKTIPALVIEADKQRMMINQMVANIHKIETPPMQYTQQLLRLLSMNPNMTEAELAGMLSVTPEFINQRLKLTKLTAEVGKLVDNGSVSLQKAHALAKMTPEMQREWIQKALDLPSAEFVPAALKAAKDAAESARAARGPAPEVFEPHPVLRKLAEIKDEVSAPAVVPLIIQKANPQTIEEAVLLGIKWAVQMDPASIEVQQARWTERKKKEADEKAARQAERDAKKAAVPAAA